MEENVMGWDFVNPDNGVEIYIGYVPGRKQVALCTSEVGSVEHDVHAYFRSPLEAKLFMVALRALTNAKVEGSDLGELQSD